MVSALSSFSGLSATDIATLFGTAASSSDPTTKDGTKTSAGAASGTPITGAGGTNAAKAIQTIVTQIQLEKMQTSSQGKISTYSLASVSVSATYGATAEENANPQTINSGTTVLNSVATATGDDLAAAVGMLTAQVKGQESQVEAAQDGLLMTYDEMEYDGDSGSTYVNWTGNDVTIAMNKIANQGVELNEEDEALNGIQYWQGHAQNFQAQPATSTPATGVPTPATSYDASSSSTNPSANGSALYLEISSSHGSFGVIADLEQQMVSDFEKGALPGQNGTAPAQGDGFSYSWKPGNKAESSYAISAVMISNYDPAAVANRTRDYVDQNSWMSADEKTVAMGGMVVDAPSNNENGMMFVVVPRKNS